MRSAGLKRLSAEAGGSPLGLDPMQANTSLELQLERTAERLRPHVAQAGHGALAALLGVCNRALAETSRLQALPPPPPVGADVQDEQRSQIEDLRAVEEVHRRQLGARRRHDAGPGLSSCASPLCAHP